MPNPEAHPDLQPLEGKYEILEKMAEGGMGAVYKVHHRLLEEIRVIKVIRPQLGEDEESRARFLREARSAVRLRHPNIALLHDFTIADDGTSFMVMEYIDGMNLVDLVRQHGQPSIGLVLEIGMQALRALGYLHKNHFVHRDVSPDNIMLTRDVEGNRLVKLIDLGIAKPIESEQSLTSQGLFLGKVRYASPEQFGGTAGDAVVEPRSDLYSFGIVLYVMLTGKYPIQGKDHASLMAGHLFHPPVPFERTDPEGRVPESLRVAISKALEKDPEKRFATAEEFANTLAYIRSTRSEADEESDALAATVLTPMPVAPPPPGKTQDQLDDHFAAEPTPIPYPTATTSSPAGTGPSALVIPPLPTTDGAAHAATAAPTAAPTAHHPASNAPSTPPTIPIQPPPQLPTQVATELEPTRVEPALTDATSAAPPAQSAPGRGAVRWIAAVVGVSVIAGGALYLLGGGEDPTTRTAESLSTDAATVGTAAVRARDSSSPATGPDAVETVHETEDRSETDDDGTLADQLAAWQSEASEPSAGEAAASETNRGASLDAVDPRTAATPSAASGAPTGPTRAENRQPKTPESRAATAQAPRPAASNPPPANSRDRDLDSLAARIAGGDSGAQTEATRIADATLQKLYAVQGEAQGASAARLAPAPFEAGKLALRQGENLQAAGDPVGAARSYRDATDLFARAEREAVAARTEGQTAAQQAASASGDERAVLEAIEAYAQAQRRQSGGFHAGELPSLDDPRVGRNSIRYENCTVRILGQRATAQCQISHGAGPTGQRAQFELAKSGTSWSVVGQSGL